MWWFWLVIGLSLANDLQSQVDRVSRKYATPSSRSHTSSDEDSWLVRQLKETAGRVRRSKPADAVTFFETKGVCDIPSPQGTLKMLGVSYRLQNGEEKDAVAVYGSDRASGQGVVVRVHDQCVTGEVFLSFRCDCREQLMSALQYLVDRGGVLIYLQQEGRNIGLANKVAAYQAQQELGLDTVDANLHLGLPEDARTYRVIPYILEALGIESVHLLTNNPRKVDLLRQAGVDVLGTIHLPSSVQKDNENYLRSKVARMAHNPILTGAADAISRGTVSCGVVTASKPLEGPSRREPRSLKEIIGLTPSASAPHNMPRWQETPNKPHWDEMEATPTLKEVLGSDHIAGKWIKGPHSVVRALESLAEGKMVIVVDDEGRENEGDLIMAASKTTPEDMGFIIRHSGGVVCAPMLAQLANKLNLPPMTLKNEDVKDTAFTVSVDLKDGSTGISGGARSATVQRLASAGSEATEFSRPGHVFPLVAKAAGTLARQGHTEAGIDLVRLAGLPPVAVISEIFSENAWPTSGHWT
ncbi:MAG: uncharacterized protein KVP18_001184 [Porospora cf. gigantea A]|uniref:uncharacterized protein n=1 Tax=Porospora cf. gigantea A TaxID=2853593 RepID=UPI003559C9F8|nr:MAG: hypothetical protein KVP18_001184 [Porospora cf. gigantea A]